MEGELLYLRIVLAQTVQITVAVHLQRDNIKGVCDGDISSRRKGNAC